MPNVVIDGSGPNLAVLRLTEDQITLLTRLLANAMDRLDSEVVDDDRVELDQAA